MPKTLILYQPAHIGHFCCVFRNKEGINYFDPLGYYIDHMTDVMTPKQKKQMKHDHKYMCQLLYDANETIIYNEIKLQTKHTSTCGKWCAIRLIYSDLTNDEFNKIFMRYKGKERDRKILKLYNAIKNNML